MSPDVSEGPRFSPREAAVLELVLAGTPVGAIARRLKISRRTVLRIRDRPHVRDALFEATSASVTAAIERLEHMGEVAVDAVAELIAKGDGPTRLAAARIVLERIAAAVDGGRLASNLSHPGTPGAVDLTEHVLAVAAGFATEEGKVASDPRKPVSSPPDETL